MKQSIIYLSLFLLVSSYLLVFPYDVMDIDASQYAEITREMVAGDLYTALRDNGRQYLDKPILTFWILAASFKLFGANNFAYRLPALIFLFLAAFSLYRLADLLFRDRIKALLAAAIFLAIPGSFAMVLDPKIDIYLTAFLVFTFHCYFLAIHKSPRWFYGMYFFIGLGVATKGPIGAALPVLAIGGDILLRRDWGLLKSMRIFPGVLVAAFLPLLWGYFLFREFSWYGPNYYFWIQSFGKFTGEGKHTGKLNPLFFISNFSWEFLPFTLMFFYLVGVKIRHWRQTAPSGWKAALRHLQDSHKQERGFFVLAIWFFVFLFLISFSSFQLPQYVFWILPAAALLMANWLVEFSPSGKWPAVLWSFYPLMLVGLVFWIPLQVLDVHFWYYVLAAILLLGVVVLMVWRQWSELALFSSALAMMVVNLYIYPFLLSYQPSSRVGKKIRKLEPDQEFYYSYRLSFSLRSYAFYSRRLRKSIYNKELFAKELQSSQKRLVLLPAKYLTEMKAYLGTNYQVKVLAEYDSYKVAKPKKDFFLKKNRTTVLKKIILSEVQLVD